jgi:hypothetical protein
MPDGVVSGYKGGLDMAQWRRMEEREEDQTEVGVVLRR